MNQAEGAFWTWSLEHYQRDSVEAVLLQLQDDHNLNVNMLLWAAWCATHTEPLSDDVIRKAMRLTREWSANVTSPLRAVRRYLKAPTKSAAYPDAPSLRSAIKTSELAAEKVEQALLEAFAYEHILLAKISHARLATYAAHNLTAYARLAGAMNKSGFKTSLLESLADHIFSKTQPDPGF